MIRQFKNRVQEFRWKRGWSQEQLSRESGVPRSTIHAVENGVRVPSVHIALKLAAALSVTVDDLFGAK